MAWNPKLRWVGNALATLTAVSFLAAARAEIVYPSKLGALVRIVDLAAASGSVFVLHERDMARSNDGGDTWTHHKLPTAGRSLFFLDSNSGWLVAEDGLHSTQDGGIKWKRTLKSKDLLRCWFLTMEHGYAVGDHKAAFETLDGGKNWRTLEAATGVLSDPERTSYTSVEFSGNTGFITGHHTPKRPAQDSAGRQWPQLGIAVQTVDGGESWKPSSSAVFGRLARARLRGRTAALLLQFDYDFEWPSEVYRIDLPTGETRREYREPDRKVCAVAVLGGGTIAVASARVGKNRASGPRPMELSVGGTTVEIDERLTAAECYLQAERETLWLATDEGFLEKLTAP